METPTPANFKNLEAVFVLLQNIQMRNTCLNNRPADGPPFPTLSSQVSQLVVVTRRPGTCPGTRAVWRAAVTAGQQSLAGLHSLHPPTVFLPGGATTHRDQPAICSLVGRDQWKTQSLPAVPSCISSCQRGIWGYTEPLYCYWGAKMWQQPKNKLILVIGWNH